MRTIRRLRDLARAALVAAVPVVLLGAMMPAAVAAPLSLTLVHVNDWDQMAGIKGAGGAAKIAAVVAEERAKAEAEGGLAVVTFGGDMISPSVLSGIDKGAHMIDLANAVGIDVAVLGNHEFDFGPDVLQERLDETLDVEIGETATELDTRGFLSGAGETAFGNLLADAMRQATGSDIALSNGGGIRGDTVYPPGTRLTRKTVLTELPFGNKTVVLRLAGAQVREALENGVSQVAHPSGRFPQVSGLAFSFDARRPPGARVTSVTVGGAAMEDGRTYTLATNDFLARGGDGYTVFQAGEMLIDSASGELMAGQLIDHIVAAGTVAPAIEGRITRAD